MALVNPIQYTSRTITTIVDDINNDLNLRDKPDWFKKLIGGLGDTFSVMLNAQANQAFLFTAFTREAVRQHLRNIGYEMTEHQTATGSLIFYLDADSTTFPAIFAKSDLAALSPGTVAVPSKRFEVRSAQTIEDVTGSFTTDFSNDEITVSRVFTTGEKVRVSSTTTLPAPLAAATDYYVIKISDTIIKLATTLANAKAGTAIDLTDNGAGTHTFQMFSFILTAYQQETLDSTVTLGTSDGSEWQEFSFPDNLMLKDTLIITINSEVWTRVDDFSDSTATDKHFIIFYNTGGAGVIRFGNNTYGQIPGNFDIEGDYAFGGGSDSNVFVLAGVNIYAGADSRILAVENVTSMQGGADEESIESAKILGPLLLKARDNFIFVEDAEALSLTFDGVGDVKVERNAFGPLSTRVVVVPLGGGLPSAQLKSDLDDFLTNKSILRSVDVRVEDPVYVVTDATTSSKMRSGFVFSENEDYIKLAMTLIFTEVAKEILDILNDSGIAAATTFINTKFGFSFATSTDLAQVQKLLNNLDPDIFDSGVQESDALGYLDTYVDAIDYVQFSLPTFPVTVTSQQITQAGTMSALEIT